jgi:hypothetical protein
MPQVKAKVHEILGSRVLLEFRLESLEMITQFDCHSATTFIPHLLQKGDLENSHET